ncbi:thiamine pyrophosphate-binding protein [Herbaspirillum autotrophicum]|uniref:thiamine pyrophosphate-binding protein n=1 Tax=Herbaspirillum autotrophicum TaxID=180195 RepID=UPI00067DE6C1|nr:thiamine pyrophosphate-binding protein [Herbaspirillum autotrophicum]
MKRVSEQIAEWFVHQGLKQVFSVTGGGAMFLNQALGNNDGLQCTFMHHEQACAMAAEGYARIAGKPAIVMVTTGPGAINAFNGVYGAYTDSIPMIVISGQVKRETCLSFHELPALRQLGDQEGPTIAMASAICKYAEIIRQPADLERILPEAFRQAVTGRPGPVWLDIPLDIQSAVEELHIPDVEIAARDVVADAAMVAQYQDIMRRLASANRPLILAGTGVRLADAGKALLQFAERTGIPVATAWTHDLIASDHPLFAGRPGTIGTRAGNFCLQNADFVLVLGSRLNIRQTSYNWDSFAKNAWVAQVDIDPAELAKPTIKVDQPIVADVRHFIAGLSAQLEHAALPDYSAWARWCRNIGDEYAVVKEHRHVANAPLNPYLVVDRVFRNMRDDDIAACGNASACILPFQIGSLKAGQRLFSNSGSASMGYDLPAALGAATAVASHGGRVICFAGDGSLQMNIQELQTLKSAGLNVIVVVINNGGYVSIWQTHENFFGKVIGATPASGVDFPDYAAVARAYGIRSATIRGEQDLDQLDQLLASDGPLLLDIVVDARQEFTPRIKSRVDENGKFVTPELDDMFPFLSPQIVDAIRVSANAISAAKR